jgi:hypothetical protein
MALRQSLVVGRDCAQQTQFSSAPGRTRFEERHRRAAYHPTSFMPLGVAAMTHGYREHIAMEPGCGWRVEECRFEHQFRVAQLAPLR